MMFLQNVVDFFHIFKERLLKHLLKSNNRIAHKWTEVF